MTHPRDFEQALKYWAYSMTGIPIERIGQVIFNVDNELEEGYEEDPDHYDDEAWRQVPVVGFSYINDQGGLAWKRVRSLEQTTVAEFMSYLFNYAAQFVPDDDPLQRRQDQNREVYNRIIRDMMVREPLVYPAARVNYNRDDAPRFPGGEEVRNFVGWNEVRIQGQRIEPAQFRGQEIEVQFVDEIADDVAAFLDIRREVGGDLQGHLPEGDPHPAVEEPGELRPDE